MQIMWISLLGNALCIIVKTQALRGEQQNVWEEDV